MRQTDTVEVETPATAGASAGSDLPRSIQLLRNLKQAEFHDDLSMGVVTTAALRDQEDGKLTKDSADLLVGTLSACRKAFDGYRKVLEDPSILYAVAEKDKAEREMNLLRSAFDGLKVGSLAEVEQACQQFRQKLAP